MKLNKKNCPRCRWVCFFIGADLEKFSIISLTNESFTNEPMDPLQWMGAVRMRVQTAWIYGLYFCHKQQFKAKMPWWFILMDLFLTNTQLFASQDINWCTGVVWITCGLLWCNQLFGLSFWRHPFTAEDPLLSKWWNATFFQICSVEETNSSTSWMAWGWVHILVLKFKFWGELLFLAFMQNLEKVFKHRDLQQKLLETKLTQANLMLKEAEEKHKLQKEHVSKTSKDFI